MKRWLSCEAARAFFFRGSLRFAVSFCGFLECDSLRFIAFCASSSSSILSDRRLRERFTAFFSSCVVSNPMLLISFTISFKLRLTRPTHTYSFVLFLRTMRVWLSSLVYVFFRLFRIEISPRTMSNVFESHSS